MAVFRIIQCLGYKTIAKTQGEKKDSAKHRPETNGIRKKNSSQTFNILACKFSMYLMCFYDSYICPFHCLAFLVFFFKLNPVGFCLHFSFDICSGMLSLLACLSLFFPSLKLRNSVAITLCPHHCLLLMLPHSHTLQYLNSHKNRWKCSNIQCSSHLTSISNASVYCPYIQPHVIIMLIIITRLSCYTASHTHNSLLLFLTHFPLPILRSLARSFAIISFMIETISHPIDNIRIRFKSLSFCARSVSCVSMNPVSSPATKTRKI